MLSSPCCVMMSSSLNRQTSEDGMREMMVGPRLEQAKIEEDSVQRVFSDGRV